MAWEWVAPAGTTAVGIAGIASTFFTARQGRKHAETVAAQKNAADLALAREQRQQQREAEAYVEILTIAERIGQWASAIAPMFDEGQSSPELPDLAAQARGTAILNAYGSSKALVFYDAWRKVAQEIYVTATEILRIRARGSGSTDLAIELGRKLDLELRQKEVDARKALVDELASELQGVRRFQKDVVIS